MPELGAAPALAAHAAVGVGGIREGTHVLRPHVSSPFRAELPEGVHEHISGWCVHAPCK